VTKKNIQQTKAKKIDIRELIDNAAYTTADKIIKELKKQRFLKESNYTAYQKTEQILYNYNNFQDAIRDKKEQIKEITSFGLPAKSKSITFYHSGSFTNEETYDEKINERIKSINDSIVLTEKYIKTIDCALEKIEHEKYFNIITMKYFENKTTDEIAEYYEVDETTINRNKKRLIDKLKITLFSDEALKEMLS